MKSKTDPGIALSLGSAFLGYDTHAGFLSGLNQCGIFPGKTSGASAGALAAALYAAGIRDTDLQQFLLSPRFKRAFLDPGFLYRWIPMLVLGQPTGLLSGKNMVNFLKKELPVQNIEDCPDAELSISVSNLRKQEHPVLTTGPLANSIMASCSVPLLFSEQEIKGERYFDGGILQEAPIEHFLDDPGIHTIIVHRVNYPGQKKRRFFFIHDVFTASHNTLTASILSFQKREAAMRGKKLIFLETIHSHPGFFPKRARREEFHRIGMETGLCCSDALENPTKPVLNDTSSP
ncbi:patatin-like phospholipase family protein [Verrucomicrobiaceae bacterium 227]